jgi:hypothetical protein
VILGWGLLFYTSAINTNFYDLYQKILSRIDVYEKGIINGRYFRTKANGGSEHDQFKEQEIP